MWSGSFHPVQSSLQYCRAFVPKENGYVVWLVSQECVPTACQLVYLWLTFFGNLPLPVPLGTIKTSANYRLFPPQITATSISRWPETGVVATHSRLKVLHTCGQEPVPVMGSEGAVCALRWRWVGATEGWGQKADPSLVRAMIAKKIWLNMNFMFRPKKNQNELRRTVSLLNITWGKQGDHTLLH